MNGLLFQNEQTIAKEKWKDEWVNMPEFVQEKQEPFAKIIIRFDNQEALDDFANLISQKLTNKTKSIWHPFKSHWGAEKKVYVNES
jgi:hypothetical protein